MNSAANNFFMFPSSKIIHSQTATYSKLGFKLKVFIDSGESTLIIRLLLIERCDMIFLPETHYMIMRGCPDRSTEGIG